MESAGKRDRGRQFELLLLLLFIYVGAALGIGGGKCKASPVRGMAEGGREQAKTREGEAKLAICRGTARSLCCSWGRGR